MKNLQHLTRKPLSKRYWIALLLTGSAFGLLSVPVLAETVAGGDEIDWFRLGMGLFGGLAMFLFGMDQMSEGLKAAAGDTLKEILGRLTKNRFLGAVTGAFVTAVLNSSSVTTVLVVGFISAGFMTLAQSVGVIMGANIGSTFTAQIVAFNVTQYALVMVAIGFFMLFAGKRENTQHYGSMVMGLGLVFYGMGVMGESMEPLRSYQPFLDLMISMEKPALGILVGAVFTGLVQSSAATTGIAIVMATEGLISLPAGIALAFGANIGTCVTAILAALGKPVEAVRAAVVHVLFNIAGVLVWVMFIPQLVDIIVSISPSAPELSGKERMAAEVPRQIANAHTVFNIANTLLFISFTTLFARVAEKLVPARPVEKKTIITPRYLDNELITVPSMALERVRLEIGHMGEIINDMFSTLREGVETRDMAKCDSVLKMDDKVDILHEAIFEFLSDIRKEPLTDHQSDEFQVLMSATINLENLADVLETELVSIGKAIINQGIRPTEVAEALLRDLGNKVQLSIANVVKAVREDDQKAAEEVIIIKDEVRRIAEQFLAHQTEYIGISEGSRLAQLRLELELLDKLRRIYTLAKRVAKDFVPEEVANKA
ncbi:MAG: Na/Pi cotransporter family protein [Candidatus Thiodiazotropha sp. (ex Monitilora ramsayi)]|nr:Na/Pi cotransporter family protein [Candidatus Thiodiazotropha sp. (ex Monitilora ramsayi)]